MKFIESLHDGDRVMDIYLCKKKQSAVTKNGKSYDNLTLQDKTGVLDAKIWDPNSQGIDDFEQMDYVEVTGEIVTFNGMLQLNVRRIRKVKEGEYDPQNYFPITNKSVDEMYQILMQYASKIQNPYMKRLIDSMFVDDPEFIQRFKNHSAAKAVHHGFIGGLLEHTLGVVRLCSFYTKCYPPLQYDLLIPAAMLHDVGKLWEISVFPENDYTDEGQLLGHIVIGIQMIAERAKQIDGFPIQLLHELQHCILAHHGELEYGSPKKPALLEALALSFADNTDAKMETMMEALRAGGENTDWLGFNRYLDSNIRKTNGLVSEKE